MTFSDKAINDLRKALNKSYGDGFDACFNDQEISEIGELVLTVLSEELKLRGRQRSSDLFLGQRV